MYLSFGMIHQGTRIRVLNSKSQCKTILTHITIWSNLLVQTLLKDWQNWYVYIYNTIHIWESTNTDVMHISSVMISEGITMQWLHPERI